MRNNYVDPFDDEKLIYDYDKHRYKLAESYITNTFGDDVAKNPQLQDLIEDVTDNIYLYIYSMKTGQTQYDIMEYEMACNEKYREWIAEALIKQFQYAYTTSGDKVSEQHGIDINNDKTIAIQDLRNELFVSYKSIIILQVHDLLTSQAPDTNFDYDTMYRVNY